jgi:sugar phosphate isomerase/epimerase
LEQAAGLGFAAVELDAAAGETSPTELTESGRRHLARFCGNLGLDLAALSADVGPGGLADPAAVDAHVDRTRRVLELAADLRIPVVTADVGYLVDPRSGEPSPVVADALRAIAEHADRVGTIFGLQSGPDPPDSLHRLLRQMGCPSLKVCLDPAGLARFGHPPIEAVGHLAEDLALSHLGDATFGGPGRPGVETQLGRGQLDLPAFLAELAAAGYLGPLILRRRDSQRPVQDLAAAAQMVRPLLI